jgi:hypothetical protein
MRHYKRSLKFLVLSILSLFVLSALILFFPPGWILDIGYWKLEILYVFFPLLFLFLFFIGTYLFKSKKHGFFIGLFVMLYLIMRLNSLTHPFFFILLAGLFLTLELMVSRK